jgi:hypothetical protein
MSFGTKEFWDSWYDQELPNKPVVEWYINYESIKSNLKKYIKSDHDILITGCGNSTLGISLL